MTEDLAPLPLDAGDPPPKKRGLGRGLDDVPGHRVVAGEKWTAFDFLTRGMVRANARHVPAQPVALHRLPDPILDSGPLNLHDILPAPTPPTKPRTLSESAAILNRALEHPSEAIRIERPEAPAPAVVEPEPAPDPAPEPPRGRSALRAALAKLNDA